MTSPIPVTACGSAAITHLGLTKDCDSAARDRILYSISIICRMVSSATNGDIVVVLYTCGHTLKINLS